MIWFIFNNLLLDSLILVVMVAAATLTHAKNYRPSIQIYIRISSKFASINILNFKSFINTLSCYSANDKIQFTVQYLLFMCRLIWGFYNKMRNREKNTMKISYNNNKGFFLWILSNSRIFSSISLIEWINEMIRKISWEFIPFSIYSWISSTSDQDMMKKLGSCDIVF